MKEEPISCMICKIPVAIVRLNNDYLEFNKDVDITMYNSLVCEDCLRNKNIMTNIDKIWNESDDKLQIMKEKDEKRLSKSLNNINEIFHRKDCKVVWE